MIKISTEESLEKIKNIIKYEISEKLVPVLGPYVRPENKAIIQNIVIAVSNPPNAMTPIDPEKINMEGVYDTARHKINSLIAKAKFVIVEDSVPSGAILELEYCKNVGAITAIFRKRGKKSSWMSIDFEIHSEDFCSFEYDDWSSNGFEKMIKGPVLDWVEERKKKRNDRFKELEERFKNPTQEEDEQKILDT